MLFLGGCEMQTLGIALVVVGLALLCAGIFFYRSPEESEDSSLSEDRELSAQAKEPPSNSEPSDGIQS
jgi:hypothetical protein